LISFLIPLDIKRFYPSTLRIRQHTFSKFIGTRLSASHQIP